MLTGCVVLTAYCFKILMHVSLTSTSTLPSSSPPTHHPPPPSTHPLTPPTHSTPRLQTMGITMGKHAGGRGWNTPPGRREGVGVPSPPLPPTLGLGLFLRPDVVDCVGRSMHSVCASGGPISDASCSGGAGVGHNDALCAPLDSDGGADACAASLSPLPRPGEGGRRGYCVFVVVLVDRKWGCLSHCLALGALARLARLAALPRPHPHPGHGPPPPGWRLGLLDRRPPRLLLRLAHRL